MSLDLSADLLITDLAPIPALIQRLGRLNRRATPEQPGTPRPFIVLPVGGRAKPYSTKQLDEASDWLQRLGPAPLSQADLVAAWTSNTAAPPARVVSAWLDGGFSYSRRAAPRSNRRPHRIARGGCLRCARRPQACGEVVDHDELTAETSPNGAGGRRSHICRWHPLGRFPITRGEVPHGRQRSGSETEARGQEQEGQGRVVYRRARALARRARADASATRGARRARERTTRDYA